MGEEECDDGNNVATDACLNNCTEASCGDKIVGPGEACDDGNAIDDDECTNKCALGSCGDGIVQMGEMCDDGNAENTDGCLDTCVPASCGDGFVQAGEEGCDEGPMNADSADCTLDCTPNVCGDGKQHATKEECDDGNKDETDACTSICAAAECGDGHVFADVEECDDGDMDNTDMCTTMCKKAACGDGFVQAGEECDDGDMDNTDACTTLCKNAKCGDGFVQGGEACDDGNGSDFDKCKAGCVENVCGDFVLDKIEEDCDHGTNNDMAAACDDACKRKGFLVFVTSDSYKLGANNATSFNSVAAADARCGEAAAADGKKLKIKGGTWKAWVSNAAGTPASMGSFHQSPLPYISVMGGVPTTIANDWADLTDGDLIAPINITDNNMKLMGAADCDATNIVWTGTTFMPGVKAENHCTGWSSASGTADGTVGTVTAVDVKWSDTVCMPETKCNATARLYCFEQP